MLIADVSDTGAPHRGAPAPPRRRWRLRGTDGVTGWALVTPAMVLIGIFGLLPVLMSLQLSFQHSDLLTPETPWVGLDNTWAEGVGDGIPKNMPPPPAEPAEPPEFRIGERKTPAEEAEQTAAVRGWTTAGQPIATAG